MERQALCPVPEGAKYLGVSRAKMYEMVKNGVVPSVRVGPRCIRIPIDALDRWIAENTTGGR